MTVMWCLFIFVSRFTSSSHHHVMITNPSRMFYTHCFDPITPICPSVSGRFTDVCFMRNPQCSNFSRFIPNGVILGISLNLMWMKHVSLMWWVPLFRSCWLIDGLCAGLGQGSCSLFNLMGLPFLSLIRFFLPSLTTNPLHLTLHYSYNVCSTLGD